MKPENFTKKLSAKHLKTEAAACRNQLGNLVTDYEGMLGVWSEHFDDLLDGDTNTHEVEPEIPIADGGIDIPPPDYDEV